MTDVQHKEAMIKMQGAVGLVSDGPARDIDEIEAFGLPVYARGITPAGPLKTGAGEIGTPITIGHVQISTGDVVNADRHGVVVVSAGSIANTIQAYKAIRQKEIETVRMPEEGKTPERGSSLASETGVFEG